MSQPRTIVVTFRPGGGLPAGSRGFRRGPGCAWMVDDAAGVKGYTFGRPGYRYHQLGPVVAADAATARDMVIRCLSPLGGRVFAIDVPLLDGEWLDLFQSVGGVVGAQLLTNVPRTD